MLRITITTLAAIAASAWTSPARACEPLFDPPVVLRPELAAAITKETVAVTCTETDCVVTATYELAGAPELRTVARETPSSFSDVCFVDGITARHPWLGGRAAPTQHAIIVETATTPHVEWPRGWELVATHDEDPDRHIPRTTFLFSSPPEHFVHGGPVLLAGVASGAGETFRMRGSWEAAVGRPWLVFAGTAGSDGASMWDVALTAEATSRASLVPMTFGAGGGAVMTFGSGRHAGGRAQVSAALGPGRIVLSTDVTLPTSGPRSAAVSVALLGGFSI
jgi:hypothetical protein